MPHGRVSRDLMELATLYGVQLWHRDGFWRRQQVGEESLLAVLSELGAGIERSSQAADAVRRRRAELATRIVEPAQVSWSNQAPVFRFSLPATTGRSSALSLALSGDDGYQSVVTSSLGRLTVIGSREEDGGRATGYLWPLPEDLPGDIYECVLEADGQTYRSTLLRAPFRAADLPGIVTERGLALFLPAYAIRSGASWGMGDLSDLGRLQALAAETGAGAVATLPLSPVFEDDPSPYSPVSRLFWNELFIDPRAVPELATCDDARRRVESPALRERVAELERAEFVDYRAQFEIRWPILQALANHAASTPALKERLDRFAADHPNADNYAKFRAACERMGRPWQSWRLGLERELRPGEHFDPAAYSYHLNSQRLAFDQVGSLARRGREGQPALFLDMPLGVRGDGFDVCLKPEIFASHASAGAPPDAFFSSGQVWGFPPLRPEALRRDGYRYLRDSIRHIASQAGMIRIDHVMGMHRLFWVPGGMGAAEGAYVRYPAAEMYAVATLESRRADAAVVGEDLGSVPGYVGPAMRRHNLRRMYAAYFKVHTGDQPSLEEPEPGMFAYINTHDMATFAAFVSGEDIDERRGRGLLTEEAAGHERWERGRALAAMRAQMERDGLLHHGDGDPAALLRALAKWLLRSEAAATVLNLEDLWLEPRPQNVPGTSFERPNWRRRSRLTLDEIKGLLSGLLV